MECFYPRLPRLRNFWREDLSGRVLRMSWIFPVRGEDFLWHMCGRSEKAYCSCHNLDCPICHGVARRIWVGERLDDLLTVPHYHVVFTLPD